MIFIHLNNFKIYLSYIFKVYDDLISNFIVIKTSTNKRNMDICLLDLEKIKIIINNLPVILDRGEDDKG